MDNDRPLKITELHIGDWVKAWSPMNKKFTPPIKVAALYDNGRVVTINKANGCKDDRHSCDIYPLPITDNVLRYIGYKLDNKIKHGFHVDYVYKKNDVIITIDYTHMAKVEIGDNRGYYKYMSEAQEFINKYSTKI